MIHVPHNADNRRPNLRVSRHIPHLILLWSERKNKFLLLGTAWLCHHPLLRNTVQSHLICNGCPTLLIVTL